MTVTVEVPPRYIRYALEHAKDRNESFMPRESYQKRVEKEDRHPQVDNLIGVVGEIAFAIYADLQIDSEIYQTGDSGIDFHLRIKDEEITVDLKTRTGDLFTFWVEEKQLQSNEKHTPAEYYVLGKLRAPVDFDAVDIEDIETIEGWEVKFLGTATREEFLDARRIESDKEDIDMKRSILLDNLHPVPDPDEIEQIG